MIFTIRLALRKCAFLSEEQETVHSQTSSISSKAFINSLTWMFSAQLKIDRTNKNNYIHLNNIHSVNVCINAQYYFNSIEIKWFHLSNSQYNSRMTSHFLASNLFYTQQFIASHRNPYSVMMKHIRKEKIFKSLINWVFLTTPYNFYDFT